MKMLFIYTREFPQSHTKPLVDFEAIQFGISHISSYLKKNGHEVRLLVLTRESNFTIIDKMINDFNPQIIGFTAVASEYLFIERIGIYIKKKYPYKFLIAGGVHVSLVPKESMMKTFDALCIGEGEDATLELVQQLESGVSPSGIANLWIKKGSSIEKNPTRHFIADLNSLPYADREIWLEWIDLERSPKRPSLLLGRGCPFSCTYCCNHSLRRLAEGTYVRFRSPENIIGEIKEILARFPEVKEIYFEIETLGANLGWGLELCHRLEEFNAKRTWPLSFGVNLRITPNMKRIEELFSALRRSNFRFVNIGLESGSERVRREVLRRNYSNEDIIKAVTLAKQNNLDVMFYNLIGLPSETVDDFKETVKMNQICLPSWNNLSIFYPYPGTDLHKLCQESGLIPSDLLATDKERVKATLNFPEFSKKQIQKAFIWFNYYVYRGHRPDDLLFNQIIMNYFQVHKGYERILVPFIIVGDLLSPSRKFFTGYEEHKIIKHIFITAAGLTIRKMISIRIRIAQSIIQILRLLLPPIAYNFTQKLYSTLLDLKKCSARLKWKLFPLIPQKRHLLYPKLVSIFLTTRCNLRCFICRPDGFKGTDLRLENLQKLKMPIKYAETIELTGWGEALIYPQLEEALNYIYSLNPKDNLIQINTNGSKLSKKVAKLLSGHLKLLTISLNAAKSETYSKYMKYDFDKTIPAIKEFLSELDQKDRLKIKLHFVAHTETFREVPDFILLAYDLGISRVSIGNYFVARKDHVQYALLHVKEEYNSIINHAMELGKRFGIEVVGRKFFEEKRENYYNPDKDCFDPFNSFYAGTDGNVTPCCFAGSYSMGNVYENDFESVWFGEKFQRLRKKRHLPPCKNCSPYVPFDDYNAHFTSYLKDSEEFKKIKKDLEESVFRDA